MSPAEAEAIQQITEATGYQRLVTKPTAQTPSWSVRELVIITMRYA
jgi:hypothetical protein